jgi:hypothetical protein
MIPLEAVEALDTLLDTALRVLAEARGEGTLRRLVAVLGCMLPEDREDVVRVLERDAGAVAGCSGDNLWSRFGARPNPFAHLYTRVNGSRHPHDVRHLQVRRATVLGARIARMLPAPAGAWEPETIDAWRRLPSQHRAYVVAMSHRVLAALRSHPRPAPA